MTFTRPQYWLNTATMLHVLDEHHLTHAELADAVGVSRAYWSMLLHRHRPLSPQVRRKMLACTLLKSIEPTDLWDVEVQP